MILWSIILWLSASSSEPWAGSLDVGDFMRLRFLRASIRREKLLQLWELHVCKLKGLELLRRLYHLNVAKCHIEGVRVTNDMHHPHF